MKTMTCKQLGGADHEEFCANFFEEMAEMFFKVERLRHKK